jgi:hypothetical protein
VAAVSQVFDPLIQTGADMVAELDRMPSERHSQNQLHDDGILVIAAIATSETALG